MLRTIIVITLTGFVLSACASSLARPSLIAYGGAPSSAKASKPVAVAKVKPRAVEKQSATSKAKSKKEKHWWTPWQ